MTPLASLPDPTPAPAPAQPARTVHEAARDALQALYRGQPHATVIGILESAGLRLTRHQPLLGECDA